MKSRARRSLSFVIIAVVLVLSGFTCLYEFDGSILLSNPFAWPVVVSDFNSSLTCSEIVSPPAYVIPSLNTLVSQLMHSLKFYVLAQGRPFQYGDSPGPGCGDNLLTSTITPDFSFFYSDTSHPFTYCGNTEHPSFEIDADVYLLPQGYDLSRTQWSTSSIGPNNEPTTCITTTSTSAS